MLRRLLLAFFVAAATSLPTDPALALSHWWRFNELYSNADGSVQFMEMMEIAGSPNEFHLTGKNLFTNGSSYQFPSDLPGATANKKFLVGTQGYAALPDVPAPDYVVPNGFMDLAGDVVALHTYDSIALPAGSLPTDGVLSIDRDLVAAQNSPTNFAGETGSIAGAAAVPAIPRIGIALAAAALLIASAMLLRRPGVGKSA